MRILSPAFMKEDEAVSLPQLPTPTADGQRGTSQLSLVGLPPHFLLKPTQAGLSLASSVLPVACHRLGGRNCHSPISK